jgi:hypothetical protein
MPTYSQQNFIDDLDGLVHGKSSSLKNRQNTLNRSVRDVLDDLDLRSTKRKVVAAPNLFNDVFDYTCPSDLKGSAIIDVDPQVRRTEDSDIILTTEEEFNRMSSFRKLMIAIGNDSMVRKLKISLRLDDDQLVISELDSLTLSGGTWAAFGDAENLTADLDNFIKGNGSINWDISSAGGTTAGIQNTGLDAFDIDDYTPAGSAFVWAYLTSATNVTNFILRIGQDASNYKSKTVTTVNEGTSFVSGWNLLRFDLQSMTSVGSPSDLSCDYVTIYMTKDGAKISETDYRFDWLVLKRGKIHNIHYYSKYGWQTSAGVWIENSTATTDKLNADTDEYNIILMKAATIASMELRDYDDVKMYEKSYTDKMKKYKMDNTSERKTLITEYYSLGTIDGFRGIEQNQNG